MRSTIGYATAIRRQRSTRLARGATLAGEYVLDLAILLMAYLVATYWREVLPFGKYVGTNYQWHSPQIYLTVALGLALAYMSRYGLQQFFDRSVGHLTTLLVSIPLVDVAILAIMPLQSGLQKGYFTLLAVPLALLLVPRTPHEQADVGAPPLLSSLQRLWANSGLLRIWILYNVRSRYAQALLGVLWIVLLPLSTALVMTAVFAEIMRIHTGNTPFISFFLAAFVPWGLFNQSIAASMRSIISAMGLINQIYFPREIIVLSALGEALVDSLFMFLAMLLINALVGIEPTAMFVFLPVLLLIQVALMLGLMFTVSWLSVFVRDVPQLVSVFLQILFYLCPIIYPVSIVPHRYQFLINLNPMGLLIEAWRNVIVYDRMPDWFSLIYPAALAFGVLVFGYRHFKANEDRFADML
ncbi:MAG: ABC transporter permease [Chloroflexota bacterium]